MAIADPHISQEYFLQQLTNNFFAPLTRCAEFYSADKTLELLGSRLLFTKIRVPLSPWLPLIAVSVPHSSLVYRATLFF